MSFNQHLSIYWHKAQSAAYEKFLGIRTRGAVPPMTAEGIHYTPLPYPMIQSMLRQLNLAADDVFVDIGAGKGRVACCVSRCRIARVVALELNPELLAQAITNAKAVRGRKAPVEPVLKSADDYAYPDATVVYLYNPFNARILAAVMDRIAASNLRHRRPIRMVYANPVHDDVLAQHAWLEKYDEWSASRFPVFGYRVSFWRTVPVQGTVPNRQGMK